MEENPYKAPLAPQSPPTRPWWRLTRLELSIIAIAVALNLLIFLGLAVEMSEPPKTGVRLSPKNSLPDIPAQR